MRLSVYDAQESGDFDLIFSEKRMAGLANYIEYGSLSRKGIEVACEILQSFQWILRHFNINDMHVFATASLRNIKNTEEAVKDIFTKTDIKVDVISGEEEAELGYYGDVYKRQQTCRFLLRRTGALQQRNCAQGGIWLSG